MTDQPSLDKFYQSFTDIFGNEETAYINGCSYLNYELMRLFRRFMEQQRFAFTDPIGVVAAFASAVELGLDPDPRLRSVDIHRFHLIRDAAEPTPTQPMECYFGLRPLGIMTLARRVPKIEKIYCAAVREGDAFSYEYGSRPSIVHEPRLEPPDLPEVRCPTHVYSVCEDVTGFQHFKVMDIPTCSQSARTLDLERILVSCLRSMLSEISLESLRHHYGSDERAVRAIPENREALTLLRALELDGSIFGPGSVTEDGDIVPVLAGRSGPWQQGKPNGYEPAHGEDAAPEQIGGLESDPAPKQEPSKPRRRRSRRSGTTEAASPAQAPESASTPNPSPQNGSPSEQSSEAAAETEDKPATEQPVTRPKREQLNLPKVQ